MTDYPHYERTHVAAAERYDTIAYRRTGDSGLDLPAFSFGLWQKFGADYSFQTQREIILHAFDLGITHFDNADRYGPPHRGAQRTFGRVLAPRPRAVPGRADPVHQGRRRGRAQPVPARRLPQESCCARWS